MRTLCHGTKQSEKPTRRRRLVAGEKDSKNGRGVCVPGVTGTRKFLISFHCDTSRKLLLLSSPGVYGSYSGIGAACRGVNAPLKPKSHDKSFPVLPHLGNV